MAIRNLLDRLKGRPAESLDYHRQGPKIVHQEMRGRPILPHINLKGRVGQPCRESACRNSSTVPLGMGELWLASGLRIMK